MHGQLGERSRLRCLSQIEARGRWTLGTWHSGSEVPETFLPRMGFSLLPLNNLTASKRRVAAARCRAAGGLGLGVEGKLAHAWCPSLESRRPAEPERQAPRSGGRGRSPVKSARDTERDGQFSSVKQRYSTLHYSSSPAAYNL
jgi:hypothetical protein